MNRKEFWDRCVPSKDRNAINVGITLAYIMAAFNLLFGLLLYVFGAGPLIDAAIIAMCGIFIHILRSRVASTFLAGYYIISKIFMIVTSFGGVNFFSITLSITIATALVNCAVSTFKYQKMKKDYESGVNDDFFSGRTNPALNPYNESVPMGLLDATGGRSMLTPSEPQGMGGTQNTSAGYNMGEMPTYSQPVAQSEQYSYGSATCQTAPQKPDLTAPVQEYKDSWEMEGIDLGK